MRLTGTHTLALLALSPAAYAEVRDKLAAAGYHHAFAEGGLVDMSGIGIVDSAKICGECGISLDTCESSAHKCCPDCTHRQPIWPALPITVEQVAQAEAELLAMPIPELAQRYQLHTTPVETVIGDNPEEPGPKPDASWWTDEGEQVLASREGRT